MRLILKVLYWILRLLSWPWACRGDLDRWAAAPEITAEDQQQPMTGKAPRAKGARMGNTASIAKKQKQRGAGVLAPLFEA